MKDTAWDSAGVPQVVRTGEGFVEGQSEVGSGRWSGWAYGGHPELGRAVRNGDRSPTYPGTLSSLEADRLSGGCGEGKCQGQGQGKLKSDHQKLMA